MSPDDVLNSSPETLQRLHGQSRADELRSTAELKQLLDRIPRLVDRSDKLSHLPHGRRSTTSVDDERSNPIQMSHLVDFCLAMAVDDLQALRALMNPGGSSEISVPIFAMYPLLRGAIESSAQAIWLLEGESRKDRLTRLVRARSTEIAYEQELASTVAASIPSGPERQKIEKRSKQNRRRRRSYVNDVIESNKLNRVDCDVPMPGYGSLVESVGPRLGVDGNLIRSVWQFVSGLTHPSASRAISAATLIETAPARGNIRTTRMEANIGQITVVLSLALRCYQTADDLRRFRMLQVPGER